MEHLPEDFKLEAVRNVTDVLSRTFSSQFVFPALGHNDPPPSRRLVDMWMQWLPTEALQTFETGKYSQAITILSVVFTKTAFCCL